MILIRYLFRETVKTQISVMLVLFLIFFCDRLIRVLSDVTDGSIPSDYVLLLVGLNMPRMAELMLPLSLYVSILFTYGRLYAESEITVMHATGMGGGVLMRAGMMLTLVTALLAVGNSFWLTPWSNYKAEAVVDELAAENSLNLLVKGQFQQSPDGRAVIFINDIQNDGKDLQGVFVGQLRNIDTLKPSVLFAETGNTSIMDDGTQVLTLKDGTRYEGVPNLLNYRNTSFDEYKALIGRKDIEATRVGLDEAQIQDLWARRNEVPYLVELQWRISLIICIPLMIMVVIPLSKVNPRQGRYAKIVPALLFYLAYFISMSAMTNAMSEGKVSPAYGLWSVHLIVVLIILSMQFKGSILLKKLLSGKKRAGVTHA